MKLKLSLVYTIALAVFMAITAFGQTAWIDSGTEGGDAFIKVISFDGVINGDDTLTSGVFNLKQFKDRHTFNIITTSDDSINIKVERDYLGPNGNWVSTAVGSDTVTSSVQWIDSLESINTQWRWRFIGSANEGGAVNGFNKGFKAKVYFERKGP